MRNLYFILMCDNDVIIDFYFRLVGLVRVSIGLGLENLVSL